jgi:hypothetical protein
VLFASISHPAFADAISPGDLSHPQNVLVTNSAQSTSPKPKKDPIASPDSTASKSNGGVTVLLTTYLSALDYGSYEDVRGRNTSQATGTSSGNVNYLEAGGALLRGGYGGDQVATPDTGNVSHVTSVDTGWTSYYRGYNQYWNMTGHSYWSIQIGSTWTDSNWVDADHQF